MGSQVNSYASSPMYYLGPTEHYYQRDYLKNMQIGKWNWWK